MYDYDFSTGDIKGVEMIDELPRMTKINGANGFRIYAGRFNVSGYGTSHVYIHRNKPPYIVVELDSGWVILGSAASEETEKYYYQLITPQ